MKKDLVKFLKYGFTNKRQALLAVFFPTLIDLFNANKIYRLISSEETEKKEETKSGLISFEKYSGKHRETLLIQKYLAAQNHPAICAALVHGSIASDEVIPYSDFDGILIIDCSKIQSNNELFRLREIIYESALLMFQMDGLQHHQWEIIVKEDLEKYNEQILPIAVIKSAKVIFPDKNTSIKLIPDYHPENFSRQFDYLQQSIKRKIASGEYDDDFYSFKNLISELLLLPAVFLQTYNKEGILKKESFQKASSFFHNEDWKIIDEISALRLSWTQEEVNYKKEIKAWRFKRIDIIRRSFRTPVPSRYKNWLSEKRKTDLLRLLDLMNDRLINRITIKH